MSRPELLVPFDRGDAGTVQRSRMLGGGALRGGIPFYKFVSNKCLTAIENWAFGIKLAECHGGYMIYSRDTMERIPLEKLSSSFDFDLEMLILFKYGLDVLSVVRNYKRGKYRTM
jgi:hypothetical protein